MKWTGKGFLRDACLALLLALPMAVQGQALSAARDGQRPADADPATQSFAGPLKLFDNLYYVGTDFVSAWLLVTSEGLIMLDSLYQEYTGQALEAIAELGLDPAAIRYVLVTHGHTDHAGGIGEIVEVSNAIAGMSQADWTLSGLEPDQVIRDGDMLVLGDTTIRFFLTPGHTPGVLSMLFSVRDGAREHQAFLFGGHNVTSNSPQAFEQFIGSVQRLQKDLGGVEVNLTSHPWAALVFQRAELLARRQPGEPHPFVDGADFQAFLNERLENAQARLAEIRGQ